MGSDRAIHYSTARMSVRGSLKLRKPVGDAPDDVTEPLDAFPQFGSIDA